LAVGVQVLIPTTIEEVVNLPVLMTEAKRMTRSFRSKLSWTIPSTTTASSASIRPFESRWRRYSKRRIQQLLMAETYLEKNGSHFRS
jgi:hypothetical protein